jgi:hypothetical protein
MQMLTFKMLTPFYLLSPLLLTACASQGLDLGGAADIAASSDPNVLGTVQEEVAQVRVDGERLYWLGSGTTRTAYANGGGQEDKARLPNHPWALRGCDKSDCAATRVTYAENAVDAAAGFGLGPEILYWFELTDIPASSYVGAPYERLVFCDLQDFPNGCTGPVGSATALLPLPQVRPVAAFDGDVAFFIRDGNDGHDIVSAGFVRFKPQTAPRLIASTHRVVRALATHGDYVYWLSAADADHLSRGNSIQRALKNGSGAIEQWVDNIQTAEPVGGEESYPAAGLAFDSTYLYWAAAAQGGVIERCPLAGCDGKPEIVASQLGTPMALQVDGDRLFWSSRKNQNSFAKPPHYTLSSCTIGECDSFTTLVESLETPAAVASDEQYLYAASSDRDVGFIDESGFGFVNSLRRLAK